MKETIKFLTDLSRNNEKAWFDSNKDRYLAAKAEVDELAAELIQGIRGFDGSIGPMAPKDVTYRIYRDLRFSKDKTPYKTHMGIYINRGGKKSGFSGYYFHVGARSYGHMTASGDIWCPPDVLKIVREDIQMGGGDFRQILTLADSRFNLDSDDALKRVPAGFPADSPDAEYFRLKHFCLYFSPDDKFVTAPNLAERLVEIFKTTKPFLDYINRAIEYSREDRKEYFSSLDF